MSPRISFRFLLPATIFLLVSSGSFAWDTLPARGDDSPGYLYHPSPSDWRDINIYHMITDRFFDGDPDNNDDNPDADTNPFGTVSIHGGDFEGIVEKLDYLRMLGARAIWISPVVRNVNGVFHGYAAQDFNAIDPHWGTLNDLRVMIDAAHARGMYVIIDVVQNHMGDLATSTDWGYPSFNSDGYNLRWRDYSRRHAAPFDDLAHLHNYGNINNWEDSTQVIKGDFMGLDGIRTEDSGVRADLIRIYEGLISATDCDGFRVDTARHIEMDFWEEFLPAMYDHADSLGKTNFLIYAEAWRGNDNEVGPYTGANRFNSALYFPMRDSMESVFTWGARTADLSDRIDGLYEYDPISRYQLVNFLDNHDMARMLSEEKLNDEEQRLYPALLFLYTSLQVPCLYYGTEQGFNGANDPYDREDMFDGEFEFGPSLGDNFNQAHPLYIFIRRLNLLRAAYPELRHGIFETRWVDYAGSGLYVYTKTTSNQTSVVAFNTAGDARTAIYNGAGPQTDFSDGTVLTDQLGELGDITVGSGVSEPGMITFTLPAYGCSILIPQEQLEALPPTITSIDPTHGTTDVNRVQDIRIIFDQPMDAHSTETAFSLVPATAGTYSWLHDNTIMEFTPDNLLQSNTLYSMTIAASAEAANGTVIGAAFESFFSTGNSVYDPDLLGDYVMDGVLDPDIPILATNNGMIFWGEFDPESGALYLATLDAGEGNDHFILLDDAPNNGTPEALPLWNKVGTVASDGPYVADENDNDFVAWYRVNAPAHARTGPNGGVFEAVINIQNQYGEDIRYVYLAVAPYDSQDGGSLLPAYTVPHSLDLDQNVDAGEYLVLDLWTGEVTLPGGPFDPQEVPLKEYVIDGSHTAEEEATLLQQDGLALYADFNGKLLYVACNDAGEGDDHFIFVTTDPTMDSDAPWAKVGAVAGLLHFLADENDNDFEGWFINDQMDLSHPAATPYNNGGYLEGTLDIVDVFGTIPTTLYLAAVPFETGDGGALQPLYQTPMATVSNINLESDEYVAFDLTSFDTDGDGIPDLEEDQNANGIMDTGETGARVIDSDGDGMNDGSELVAGTNPLNPESLFKVDIAEPVSTRDPIRFTWNGATSALYSVYYSDGIGDGGDWLPTGMSHIPGGSSPIIFSETNRPLPPRRYYRVRVEPAGM